MKQELTTEDFNYYLPEELIAQKPLKDRSSSRLMILNKNNDTIIHETFKNILNYLTEDDVLVFNNTRVIPARLFGIKEETNAQIEILLLKRIDINHFQVMVKPAKRCKKDVIVDFFDKNHNLKLKMKVLKEYDEGLRDVEFQYDGVFEEIVDELGIMPLPPYIKEKLEDKERYQTVYSKINGSSAAPTAGLHFTKELINKIKAKGIKTYEVTLHVGLGTFKPVKENNLSDHKMHTEYYKIDEKTLKELNILKKQGKNIIAVGTTTARTLESSSNSQGILSKLTDNTNIFIYPPYKFKFIDSIITNFHLPKSTLIMMISAFYGKDKTFKAYEEAIKEKYRFFSFGDAMFIK